ncbi:hypothetical protein HKW90_01785 [Pseudomonas aeruginosa]|nr:hypothetical protein [Pseudomonas aeruginosa]
MTDMYRDPRDGEETWSTDSEDWSDQTLAAVIKGNKHLKVGATVYRGEKSYPDPADFLPDVDDLLMHMQEEAEGSDCGEHVDGYPEPCEEAKAELGELLKPLQEWARRHCPPDFYLIEKVQAVVLTEEHFDQVAEHTA